MSAKSAWRAKTNELLLSNHKVRRDKIKIRSVGCETYRRRQPYHPAWDQSMQCAISAQTWFAVWTLKTNQNIRASTSLLVIITWLTMFKVPSSSSSIAFWEFTQLTQWPSSATRRQQTCWAVNSLSLAASNRYHNQHLDIITEPDDWYSFRLHTEGNGLSRTRHCKKRNQHLC